MRNRTYFLVLIVVFLVAFSVGSLLPEKEPPKIPFFCTIRVLNEEGVKYGLTTLATSYVPPAVAEKVVNECHK